MFYGLHVPNFYLFFLNFVLYEHVIYFELIVRLNVKYNPILVGMILDKEFTPNLSSSRNTSSTTELPFISNWLQKKKETCLKINFHCCCSKIRKWHAHLKTVPSEALNNFKTSCDKASAADKSLKKIHKRLKLEEDNLNDTKKVDQSDVKMLYCQNETLEINQHQLMQMKIYRLIQIRSAFSNAILMNIQKNLAKINHATNIENTVQTNMVVIIASKKAIFQENYKRCFVSKSIRT